MSFIATVSASKGFAIIADSLEVPESPLKEYTLLSDYMHTLNSQDRSEDILYPPNLWLLSPQERAETEQLYREDHAEKLFPMGPFSAIAATRILSINDKGLYELIEEFMEIRKKQANPAWGFTAMLNGFCNFLNREIKIHLKNYCYLNGSLLIMAQYDVRAMRTNTCKILIRDRHFDSPNYADNYLLLRQNSSTILLSGQTHISKAFLLGIERASFRDVYKLVRNIIGRIHSADNRLPGEFMHTLRYDRFYQYLFSQELKTIDIANMSTQQAVDLASMLMRLEIDYFKFTKTDPHVGGVIRLAVVDEEGFRYIR